MDDEQNKSEWEKAGKPLFSRLWTYAEIQQAVESADPKRRSIKTPNALLETPKGWPSDTRVDPGKWVYWLPEGWMQGIRTQETSGKELKCYMSPDNRRFWHRSAVEKQVGSLPPPPEKEPKEEAATGVTVCKRYVTDPDLIPTWEEDGWLPSNWRIGFKQKPSTVHKIYIPPGQDEGFCYQKADVLEYLQSGKKLTRFGVSKPMSVRMAVAAQRKRKREGSRQGSRGEGENRGDRGFPKRFASAAEYEEVQDLIVQKLPLSQKDTKALGPQAEQLMKSSQEIQEMLTQRKFKDVQLILAMRKSKGQVPEPIILQKLCGLFYRRPDEFGDRPFFQQIRCDIRGPMKRLVCTDQHLFYSPKYSCWKVGILKEDRAGYLTCHDAAKMPWETSKPWKMVNEKLCRR